MEQEVGKARNSQEVGSKAMQIGMICTAISRQADANPNPLTPGVTQPSRRKHDLTISKNISFSSARKKRKIEIYFLIENLKTFFYFKNYKKVFFFFQAKLF